MTSRTAIDLARYHERYTHGDLSVYLTWFLASDAGPKPCLVLIPTDSAKWEFATPCIVMLEDAWVWSEAIGDPARAARSCFDFAGALGLNPSQPTDVFRIRSIVHDHLGDLLAIPPMPADMRETVSLGEATVTDRETGRTIEREVTGQA